MSNISRVHNISNIAHVCMIMSNISRVHSIQQHCSCVHHNQQHLSSAQQLPTLPLSTEPLPVFTALRLLISISRMQNACQHCLYVKSLVAIFPVCTTLTTLPVELAFTRSARAYRSNTTTNVCRHRLPSYQYRPEYGPQTYKLLMFQYCHYQYSPRVQSLIMLSAVCKVLKGLLKINATQPRGHVVMFHDITKLGGTRIINKTEKETSVQNTFQRERSTRCRGRCKSKSLLMEISQLEVFCNSLCTRSICNK